MGYRVDEIDERILYYLARDARNTTAREIAAEVDVSPGTVGNRIEHLEDAGIVRGYHADIDYEEADDLLTRLYVCDAPHSEREHLAREALRISGVVNVRRAMIGPENLHVVGVGSSTTEISRIGRELTELGVEVEREGLIEDETFHPYHPYGPDGGRDRSGRDFMALGGSAELTDLRLLADAPVVGLTIGEAAERGILTDDVLVVAIERSDASVTPKGDTEFREGDIVSLLFRDGLSEEVLAEFGGDVIH